MDLICRVGRNFQTMAIPRVRQQWPWGLGHPSRSGLVGEQSLPASTLEVESHMQTSQGEVGWQDSPRGLGLAE